MDDNVIPLKVKDKVYKLDFKCPSVIKINKDADNDIVIEIADNGVGSAWVPAPNLLEAKKKLHKIMPITEWVE